MSFAADAANWVRHASHDPHLVAAVLLSFRRWSHLDLEAEAEAEDRPSTSAAPPPTGLLGWGRRIKRTPAVRIPRIVSETREDAEEEADATTAPAVVDRRKGKRRASPQSHLEGYSSTSVSGIEEGAKVGRSDAFFAPAPEERRSKVETVVAANLRPLKVSPISCHIRRSTSKKMKAKLELQGVERTLLQEKANLLKEMEVWRKAVEELRTENGKLKIHLTPPNTSVNFHMAVEDMQLPGVCQSAAPSFPGRKDFIALPDLNDPVADC